MEKKAFKVTITPQNEDHIAKYGDEVVEFEADVVILTTEDAAFTAAAASPLQIAEALLNLEFVSEETKNKDVKVAIALEAMKLRKKLSGTISEITGLVEDDD